LKFTLITSGVLAGLYIYIYTLLQMQDYALLIGSLGLFIILGLIMWLSLKIQWGGASTSKPKTELDSPE
jgi:Inner membrane protein